MHPHLREGRVSGFWSSRLEEDAASQWPSTTFHPVKHYHGNPGATTTDAADLLFTSDQLEQTAYPKGSYRRYINHLMRSHFSEKLHGHYHHHRNNIAGASVGNGDSSAVNAPGGKRRTDYLCYDSDSSVYSRTAPLQSLLSSASISVDLNYVCGGWNGRGTKKGVDASAGRGGGAGGHSYAELTGSVPLNQYRGKQQNATTGDCKRKRQRRTGAVTIGTSAPHYVASRGEVTGTTTTAGEPLYLSHSFPCVGVLIQKYSAMIGRESQTRVREDEARKQRGYSRSEDGLERKKEDYESCRAQKTRYKQTHVDAGLGSNKNNMKQCGDTVKIDGLKLQHNLEFNIKTCDEEATNLQENVNPSSYSMSSASHVSTTPPTVPNIRSLHLPNVRSRCCSRSPCASTASDEGVFLAPPTHGGCSCASSLSPCSSEEDVGGKCGSKTCLRWDWGNKLQEAQGHARCESSDSAVVLTPSDEVNNLRPCSFISVAKLSIDADDGDLSREKNCTDKEGKFSNINSSWSKNILNHYIVDEICNKDETDRINERDNFWCEAENNCRHREKQKEPCSERLEEDDGGGCDVFHREGWGGGQSVDCDVREDQASCREGSCVMAEDNWDDDIDDKDEELISISRSVSRDDGVPYDALREDVTFEDTFDADGNGMDEFSRRFEFRQKFGVNIDALTNRDEFSDEVGLSLVEHRRQSTQSFLTDDDESGAPPYRQWRTPSVVVSDYSDDVPFFTSVSLEEIEQLRYKNPIHGSSASECSAVSSCVSHISDISYCGPLLEYGLRTPQRKGSDCSSCSTLSGDDESGCEALLQSVQSKSKLANARVVLSSPAEDGEIKVRISVGFLLYQNVHPVGIRASTSSSVAIKCNQFESNALERAASN
uniref:Uncharacterized protein n=1 Tax=Timema poppense TaxID=170557 RepID=A0A7R9CS98_TIMPO|nr:unnamed protein product [Timema poppensis]